MYYFTDENGTERSIHIIHHGKRRNKLPEHIGRENKPPKSTECRICDADKNVLGVGIARRLEKFPVVFGPGEAEDVRKKYGRRIREVMKADGEFSVAVVTADNFCYATARKVSLRKALDKAGLSKVARTNAWHAVEIAHAAAAAIQAE